MHARALVRPLVVVTGIAVPLLATACDGPTPALPPVPAPPAPVPSKATYDPALGTATLRGVVRFRGVLKRPRIHEPPQHPAEIARAIDPLAGGERWEINQDGSLPHAFVHVVEGPSLGLDGYTISAAARVEIHQRGYAFEPHVTGALRGGEVVFRNGDGCMHNVHLKGRASEQWTVTQPPGSVSSWRPRAKDFGVSVLCDLHSWMRAYVHVLDHPFFATSARGDGTFEVRGLYPGRHRFRVWHEEFAQATQAEFEVDLAPGESVREVEIGE